MNLTPINTPGQQRFRPGLLPADPIINSRDLVSSRLRGSLTTSTSHSYLPALSALSSQRLHSSRPQIPVFTDETKKNWHRNTASRHLGRRDGWRPRFTVVTFPTCTLRRQFGLLRRMAWTPFPICLHLATRPSPCRPFGCGSPHACRNSMIRYHMPLSNMCGAPLVRRSLRTPNLKNWTFNLYDYCCDVMNLSLS